MENQNKSTPVIPNKRYFTIGEASKICDVKAHVLRYWEQEFAELDPAGKSLLVQTLFL